MVIPTICDRCKKQFKRKQSKTRLCPSCYHENFQDKNRALNIFLNKKMPNDDILIELSKSYSCMEISKMYNVTKQVVYQRYRRLGISTKEYKKQ